MKSLFSRKETRKDPLWSKTEEFDEAWKRRIGIMASYIREPGAVVDIGCGMMWLEPLLPSGSTYIPIDYIRRDARTLVVDLNRDPFPKLTADVVFMSGVLEYVDQMEVVADGISNTGASQIIFSYCTLEKFGDIAARKRLNWTSHKSVFELLSIFLKNYRLVSLDDANNNSIFAWDRKPA